MLLPKEITIGNLDLIKKPASRILRSQLDLSMKKYADVTHVKNHTQTMNVRDSSMSKKLNTE
jgi:hypothetical protein